MKLFVLCSPSATIDRDRLSQLFVKKGLPPPDETATAGWRLLFSDGERFSSPTACQSQGAWKLQCAGTLAYRGLGNRAGLQRLVDDFAGNAVDSSELVGSYCLVISDGTRVRLQTDAAGLYHVFSNDAGTMLSNSLQALLVADGRQHSLRRDALLEQLLTGSIAGPDTLFADIVLMTQDKRASFHPQALEFIGTSSSTEPESRCRMGFSQCVEYQLDSLRAYFRKISALSMELGTSLGISGGYDSRLLLLLAREAGLPVSAYTYGSEAHSLEQAVAQQLAHLMGVELRTIPVRMWTELDTLELASNMEDALYRWDGRTNKGMGTFNDVHTTAVQRRAMGAARLSLNGLGGELYRNREHLRAGKQDFGTWFRYWVMGPECAAAVGNAKAMEAFVSRIAQKYARLMKVNDLRLCDLHLARRWYRDVWLPFSAGPRLCADCQTSSVLMPFADWTVSTESLRATPHLGTGGAFEAAMIRTVSLEAARLNSNYGYNFEHVPLRARLSDGARSLVPLGPRLRLRTNAEVTFSRHRSSASDPSLPPSIQEGMLTLTSLGLPIDWGVFLSNGVNRDRCYYVAHFLKTFGEHIRIDVRDTGEV